MLLKDLLAPWFHYSGSESVNKLSLDSREVDQGDLFVAVPGHQVDGRDYIDVAAKNGAQVSLVHTDNPEMHGKVLTSNSTQIFFFQLSRQLSALAAQAYPLPVERLKLVGVTGTNGKTSITQLMAQLLVCLGKQPAVMGTLGNGLWGGLVDSGNTTADPITIMAQLNAFNELGADLCAMEVSSHGLIQARVDAVPFDLAIFTNLSRDHLDYHGTMQAYGEAKFRLFKFPSLKSGVINLDDDLGKQWLAQSDSAKLIGYSIAGDSDTVSQDAAIYTKGNHFHNQGVRAKLVWPEGCGNIDSPLLGAFNLSNLLAALAGLYQLGFDMNALLNAVPKLNAVAGRMEQFTTENGITLVVDYAHTPDAIEQALKALRGHCEGELWCLFGCGGDRDKGKRPLMAQSAEAYADRIMVTSDNARSESPDEIINDVLAGLNRPERAVTQVDRELAIREVLAAAKPGDLILLAGKGHETYQEAGGVRRDYDERALARSLASGSLANNSSEVDR
ncbi:UDP-N-acetylmuramoyl-L-alanyl-D-glutamate--2,6-diaminopimelate ligase [Shewanella woodyi]|uniref:UDP-N-acetylmuramyl-tripeptide synthetase n=1 Tax=Shewanella woodyi (strain ATCC 51908 / MS32) TaxID=392500 RepID=B1KKY2_SHEWM|nr:UDP-N-acetylmuramyl-tripeptide synthetase [Shewanella woodyi ATCC 51908]